MKNQQTIKGLPTCSETCNIYASRVVIICVWSDGTKQVTDHSPELPDHIKKMVEEKEKELGYKIKLTCIESGPERTGPWEFGFVKNI